MSEKEKVWLNEYLQCWNASEAARRADYKWPDKQGQEKKAKFANEIQVRLAQIADKADTEVTKNSILNLEVRYRRNVSNKVYFVQSQNGLVKIGICSDIKGRFSDLNTSSPVELTILFWIETDEAKKVENSFHNVFKLKRVKGEWFRLTDEDLTWVKNNYGIEG